MREITYLDKRQLADNVWEFSFQPHEPLKYISGQYSHLYLDFELPRAFTWISGSTEPYLRYITRYSQPGSTYKKRMFNLSPGTLCAIGEPMGDAVLPRDSTTPLIFVAQGIAIASYIAMLKDCTTYSLRHPITLFWVYKEADDPLTNLVPNNLPLLRQHHVRPTTPLKSNAIISASTLETLIYISGSQRFTEQLGFELEADGIQRERIIYDYYEGYGDL